MVAVELAATVAGAEEGGVASLAERLTQQMSATAAMLTAELQGEEREKQQLRQQVEEMRGQLQQNAQQLQEERKKVEELQEVRKKVEEKDTRLQQLEQQLEQQQHLMAQQQALQQQQLEDMQDCPLCGVDMQGQQAALEPCEHVLCRRCVPGGDAPMLVQGGVCPWGCVTPVTGSHRIFYA